jgi:hypothetical protein
MVSVNKFKSSIPSYDDVRRGYGSSLYVYSSYSVFVSINNIPTVSAWLIVPLLFY